MPASGGNFESSLPISNDDFDDDVDDGAAGVTISNRSKSLLSNPSSLPDLDPEDADPLIRRLRDFPLHA